MLNTLISAVPTPFKKDFSLDLSKIKTLYEYLLEKRIDGVLVNGTAGEGLSLSIEERMHTTEEWLKVIGEHKKFFVATNVSCESVEDAKNLARHAMANKVDAVFFHSPSFFKPISIDLLLECCSLVAAECYPVPFYFYHLPDFTGIKYRITDFVPKAKKQIPNFKGLKFTDLNLMDVLLCQNTFPDVDIFLGREEVFLPAWNIGVKMGIGATYCLWPEKYRKIIELIRDNQLTEAKKIYIDVCRSLDVVIRYGGIRAIKAILKIRGIDCGQARLPLKPFSEEEFKSLQKDLV